MAFRVAAPDRSVLEPERKPRIEKPSHLDFIRSLPCVVTMKKPRSEAAHVRYGSRLYAKRNVGMQEKPDDRWTVPLCREAHAAQHAMSESDWWARVGLDPLPLCLALWAVSGDEKAGLDIIREHYLIKTGRSY